MVLIQGDNGQGKTNLLEAIYMLAVAKSPRASSDRALVRRVSGEGETYARIAAVVRRGDRDLRVQIDLRAVVSSTDDGAPGDGVDASTPHSVSVQKYVRVDGIPRRASDLVGRVNAVMFGANDLELVYGPPAERRRYLDVLISQHDPAYLKALQRYQRVVSQRNHLLRMIRDGASRAEELEFWDERLVTEGKQVMARRARTIVSLAEVARPIHSALTDADGGDSLHVGYRPNAPNAEAGGDDSEDGLGERLVAGIASNRRREIAQGMTVTGPHRDDLQILVDGLDAAAYASRGQSRTAVLALRLAEASYLAQESGQRPILLLDDALSELDASRRARVLHAIAGYEQCLITTADVESVEGPYLAKMKRLRAHGGTIDAV